MAEEKKKLKTISIKGKEYVTVNERVLAFHEMYPNGNISTRLLSDLNDPHVVVLATIVPDVETPARQFNAYSQGTVGDGMVNKTACLENVETSAVGRALGFMGIGIIESVASADEMAKAGATATSHQMPQDASQSTYSCEVCNSPATLKQGESKTTGKPWKGIFCSTDRKHVKWLKEDVVLPVIQQSSEDEFLAQMQEPF